MNMKATLTMAALAVCIVSASVRADDYTDNTTSSSKSEKLTTDWPDFTKRVGDLMVGRYGQPDEHTIGHLVWRDRGPYKRIIVHRFPDKHFYALEQTINYPVPHDALGFYDFAECKVETDKVRAELTSYCDTEESNVLALNLADDILNRGRAIADAREAYVRTNMVALRGRSSNYSERLLFTVPDNRQIENFKRQVYESEKNN
ncbi:MAG: hypothetical protein HY078_14245 [Elusimicrobia bacterium]|nr:hypothetical protein [Elusimicrobiota bacterium]